MLEKNEEKLKIIYTDAHFHLFDCQSISNMEYSDNWMGCTSCLSYKEYEYLKKNSKNTFCEDLFYSVGVHPTYCNDKNQFINKQTIEFIQNTNEIDAIGEIGFDFFSEDLKKMETMQQQYFEIQLNIALEKNIPVVIHCRKANDKVLSYSKELSRLPCVLMHSFMGNYQEAKTFMNKIENIYFSFGKQLLNNNKKVISCVENLPLEKLLLESDAPFQKLKNEEFTNIKEIENIYNKAYEMRKEKISFFEFSNIILRNLLYLYHGKR